MGGKPAPHIKRGGRTKNNLETKAGMVMTLSPDFSAHHTLDVEHRRRVQSLRKESVAKVPQLDPKILAEKLRDPDIAVRLAARAAAREPVIEKKMGEELAYMLSAGPVLMKYYDIQEDDSEKKPCVASSKSILRYFIPDAVESDPDAGRKGALMKEYERATTFQVDPIDDNETVCKCCGSKDVVLVTIEACRICRNCDACEPVVVETERPPSKDTVKDSTTFCYKKASHFAEHIANCQGKQHTNIPDDVFDAILTELKKKQVTNLAEVTAAQIKEILKKMRLSKYYEHTAFILNRLTGKETATLSPALVEQLHTMFKQIQGPFVRHAPAHRQNFLSYTYTLHKMVQLLGHDELLPLFPLLKSPEKLRQQDETWKRVVEDPAVRWEFVPSM
jgi:hypothetical protein